MSASNESHGHWLDAHFWEQLDRLEDRHQRVRSEHESVRRGLERLTPQQTGELRDAWSRYCEVIAELDRTTGELETFRTRAG